MANTFFILLYRFRCIIFFTLCLGNIFLLWPGIPTPDCQGQYSEALAGTYSDHHPPIMAFVWRILLYVHQGYGTMYALQTGMLSVGLWFVWKATESFIDFHRHPALLLLIFILPFWPQVFGYSVQIQKDNQFTYSFFLVASILAFFTVYYKKRLSVLTVAVCCALLVYGTGVKYQAQFVMPVLALWLGTLWARYDALWVKLVKNVGLILGVYLGVQQINTLLVPVQRQSYSWQYVKLFDLAAISKIHDKDLIPESFKTQFYTFPKLKDKFQSNAVDPYIYDVAPILCKSPENSQLLWNQWFQSITLYPATYLKHRFTNLGYCIMGRVGYSKIDQVYPGYKNPSAWWHHCLNKVIDVLGYIFISQLPVFIIGLFYLISSFFYLRVSRLAPIVMLLNGIAMILPAILLVMCMAGTPRYTFFSIIMIHASHLFAIGMYRKKLSWHE